VKNGEYVKEGEKDFGFLALQMEEFMEIIGSKHATIN
jgi:hypothetical protein